MNRAVSQHIKIEGKGEFDLQYDPSGVQVRNVVRAPYPIEFDYRATLTSSSGEVIYWSWPVGGEPSAGYKPQSATNAVSAPSLGMPGPEPVEGGTS